MKRKILMLGMVAVLLLSVGCQSAKTGNATPVVTEEKPAVTVDKNEEKPAEAAEESVAIETMPATAKEYLGDETYKMLYDNEKEALDKVYQEAYAKYSKAGASDEDKKAALQMVEDKLKALGFEFVDSSEDNNGSNCTTNENGNSV